MPQATKTALGSKAAALAGRLSEVVAGAVDALRTAVLGPAPAPVPIRVRTGRTAQGR